MRDESQRFPEAPPAGTPPGAARLWLTLTRDPVLIAERRGRWSWPWALGGTLLGAVLVLMLIQQGDTLQLWLAARTATRGLYVAAQEPNVILLPGNPYTFLTLALFGLSLIGAALVLTALHGRPPGTVWRLHGQGSVALFMKVAGAFLLIGLLGYAIESWRTPSSFRLRSEFGAVYWASFAAGIVVIALQTLGEEMIFRGYLLRVWGAVLPLRSLIVGLLVIGFTLLHTLNTDFRTDFVFNFIWFVATEILYYWLLFRTGSLTTTWGLHFANNLISMMLVVTVPGSVPDMALVVYADPVLAAGGSRLASPMAYVEMMIGMALIVGLLAWRRSPFYVAAAPLPSEPPLPPASQPDALPADTPVA